MRRYEKKSEEGIFYGDGSCDRKEEDFDETLEEEPGQKIRYEKKSLEEISKTARKEVRKNQKEKKEREEER